MDVPASPTPSPAEGIRPFVGRQRELELITSALDEARAGEARFGLWRSVAGLIRRASSPDGMLLIFRKAAEKAKTTAAAR